MLTIKPGNTSYLHPRHGGVYLASGNPQYGYGVTGPIRPDHAEDYCEEDTLHVAFPTRIEAMAACVRARRRDREDRA